MKYCLNCRQRVQPTRNVNLVFHTIIGCIAFGLSFLNEALIDDPGIYWYIIPLQVFYVSLVKSPVCPICGCEHGVFHRPAISLQDQNNVINAENKSTVLNCIVPIVVSC